MITVSQGSPITNQSTTAAGVMPNNIASAAAAASTGANVLTTPANGSDFSDVFNTVMVKAGPYKPAYVYVTPDGKVFDVGKDQGDQMVKNATSQGYDATVNGRLTSYDATGTEQVAINGVAFKKTVAGRYDTVDSNSTLSVTKNSMPGAKAITGKEDNTPIDLSFGSDVAAENAVAKLKSMGATNYRVETLASDAKDKIEKAADYYKQNNYSVSQMMQELNPLKYNFDPVQIMAYKGDTFKWEPEMSESAIDSSK